MTRFALAILMFVPSLAVGCLEAKRADQCRGLIRLDGIMNEELRKDSFVTIMQFIELDRKVSTSSRIDKFKPEIDIIAQRNQCEEFARAILNSDDIDIFRGVKYVRIH